MPHFDSAPSVARIVSLATGIMSVWLGCTQAGSQPEAATSNDAASAVTVLSGVAVCNVLDFPVDGVNVPRDNSGQFDYTAAFQAAVACSTANHVPVHVPRGTYRINQTITLDNQLMLGEQVGGAFGGNGAAYDSLPTLVLPSDAPVQIVLGHQASLAGIAIKYSRPGDTSFVYTPPDHEEATILVAGVGVNINTVKLWTPKFGILSEYNVNAGRLNIENVFMVRPLRIGVQVGGTWDCSRVRGVHLWNNGGDLPESIGFRFLHNDFISISEVSVFNLASAMVFENAPDGGATIGGVSNVNFDFVRVGFIVGGDARVTLSGSTITSHFKALAVTDSAQVAAFGGSFLTNGGSAVSIDRNASLALTGSQIVRDFENYEAPAIEVFGGRTLTVAGNAVRARGHGVYFHRPLSGPGAVTGNSFDLASNPSARGVSGDWGAALVGPNGSTN